MDGERRFTRENKDKNPWFYTSRSYGGDFISAGLLGGFSWPPRSYTCSFCRREFRSAQALGGHMNVHRRERARLRQSPPWEGQPSNPNPNPNPTLPSNSPLANASTPITYNFPSLTSSSLTCVSSSSPSSSSPFKERILPLLDPPVSSTSTKGHDTHLSRGNTKKDLFGAGDLNKFGESGEEKKRIQGDAALDLDIGLSTEGITDPIEELDLELRLGYA